MGPSTMVLIVVLAVAAVGAISLARQRPNPRLASRVPPPAWAMAGHDATRAGHSLSDYTRLPITRGWWRLIPAIRRTPIIDGYGSVYLAQPEGSLLALSAAKGDTTWCAALQPITDVSCTGSLPPAPPRALAAPVLPKAMVGPDGYIYVVGAGGVLRAFSRSLAVPLWHAFLELVPDDGVVFGTDPGILYGVVRAEAHGGEPTYVVAAVRWLGAAVGGWRRTPIPSRGLAPPTVAPDGTVLVAASSPRPGGAAMLYALGRRGELRWRLALAPGRPAPVAVEGQAGGWVAWAVVVGARRSWVIVVDSGGRPVWRWSTGYPLSLEGGAMALAHPSRLGLRTDAVAYAGTPIGVYRFELRDRSARLFFGTRAFGASGVPVTDNQDTVYVATAKGAVFDLWPDGRVRWRYDTGRTAPGALALYPDGSVLVTTRDPSGMTVAETLGAGGVPLAAGASCADPDCLPPTPAPSPRPAGVSPGPGGASPSPTAIAG